MARLGEITVDPKTVVLAKKVDAAAVGAPKPVAGLTAGTYKYAAKLQLGERSMDISMATSIREEGGAWTVTDTVTLPNGEATDTAVLDKSALTVVSRTVKQGAATIAMAMAGDKVTGKMSMSGQEKPITADVGGPLFADGPGASFSIAALPLAEGYSATFRNLDVQTQKLRLMQVKVVGSEPVTVPAGAFDAWKVELGPADGGPGKATLWIAKDSRKPVKSSAVLPQMGGAVMTAELQ
jgi:hypothetical protein